MSYAGEFWDMGEPLLAFAKMYLPPDEYEAEKAKMAAIRLEHITAPLRSSIQRRFDRCCHGRTR